MSYYAKAPVGATYGRWTVIAHGGPNKLLCRCECGTERAVDRSSLRNGTSTSCGCWRKEFLSRLYTTHGQSRTRLYRVWAAMVERCTVPSNKQYVNYGGRGISVHPEWFDFAKYKAYVDSPPKPNLPPSEDRWAKRSETYPGIAAAMAAQWAPLLLQQEVCDV